MCHFSWHEYFIFGNKVSARVSGISQVGYFRLGKSIQSEGTLCGAIPWLSTAHSVVLDNQVRLCVFSGFFDRLFNWGLCAFTIWESRWKISPQEECT